MPAIEMMPPPALSWKNRLAQKSCIAVAPSASSTAPVQPWRVPGAPVVSANRQVPSDPRLQRRPLPSLPGPQTHKTQIIPPRASLMLKTPINSKVEPHLFHEINRIMDVFN